MGVDFHHYSTSHDIPSVIFSFIHAFHESFASLAASSSSDLRGLGRGLTWKMFLKYCLGKPVMLVLVRFRLTEISCNPCNMLADIWNDFVYSCHNLHTQQVETTSRQVHAALYGIRSDSVILLGLTGSLRTCFNVGRETEKTEIDHQQLIGQRSNSFFKTAESVSF